jgi:hypothetical protein
MCWIIGLTLIVCVFAGYWVWWVSTHPPDARLEWIAGSWYIAAIVLFLGIMIGLVWLVVSQD